MQPILLAATLLAAAAQSGAPPPSPAAVQPLPPGTQTRPVQLARMVVDLDRGAVIGRLRGGLICMPQGNITWGSGAARDIDTAEFDEVFRQELTRLGFDVAGDPGNLFADANDNRAEFLVGGRIDRLEIRVCYPHSGFGNVTSSNGSASIRVNWQIFSRLERRVVATLTSESRFEQREMRSGGANDILMNAFAGTVRQLAASEPFRTVFVGAPADLRQARAAPAGLQPIPLDAGSAPVSRLPEAVGATVLIHSGSGHGSGFLVSSEGHLLTNYHVVRDARFVRVRWSDGLESLGEVLRSDRGRDVALVKVDARNRSPIRMRRDAPVQGESVFAIGAPLETNLQSSVTRGIVSANRIIDGFSYIQSDVAVNPGNSGGPLLDERQQAIGITVAGIGPNGVPVGINLFIPIADAVAFLGLQPQAPTP